MMPSQEEFNNQKRKWEQARLEKDAEHDSIVAVLKSKVYPLEPCPLEPSFMTNFYLRSSFKCRSFKRPKKGRNRSKKV